MVSIIVLEDLIGKKYNFLTIRGAKREKGVVKVFVRCDCGTEKEVRYQDLKNNKIKSCGCIRKKVSKTNHKPNTYHKGEKYKTNEGVEIEIVEYINKNTVRIKFYGDTPYETTTTMQNIKLGQIKYPYLKSVYGKGYYGVGEYLARENGEKTKSYIKWHSMLTRCYNIKYQQENPSYIGCSVNEYFLNFQNFAKWLENNTYNCPYNLELDKDLLIEGNREYSPKACCLLPKEINEAIKTQRYNVEVMRKLYNKYKDYLPINAKEVLQKLAKITI